MSPSHSQSTRALSRRSSAVSVVSTIVDADDAASGLSDSIDSDDANEKQPVTPKESAHDTNRRTRRKFTHEQLAELESLYHTCSHPTREQREELAKRRDLNLRCVTIWFQNKRQIERRTSSSMPSFMLLGSPPGITTIYTTRNGSALDVVADSPSTTSISTSSTLAMSSPLRSPLIRTTSLPTPISLDSVILGPGTPPKSTRNRLERAVTIPEGIWELMPGSPLGRMQSPEKARDFVERVRHHKHKRTLEWACAAARLSSSQGDEDSDCSMDELPSFPTQIRPELLDTVSTSITLEVSLGKSDKASMPALTKKRERSSSMHDDATMKAALVLCDLGRW